MDNSLPIQFRTIIPDDYNFIIQTWGRAYRTNYPINFIPSQIYFESQNKLINSILSTGTTIIACLDDEPNTICSYVVAEQKGDTLYLHWANTKAIFRRLGIFKSLLEQFTYKNLIVTHHFSLFKNIKERYGMIYDPTVLESYHGK